jgi:uncharacterized protein (TIGR00369 family)
MKQLNPQHVAAVVTHANDCPYFQLLSMELKDLQWGASRFELSIQEKHIQFFGIIHGGVCASVLDAAAWWAVYGALDDGIGLTTVEIKVNYLSPVNDGRLIATGKAIKIGKSICLGEGSILDDGGNQVAHGTSTMMVLDSLTIPGIRTLPPKFLSG